MAEKGLKLVKKRDGRLTTFDKSKIANAIFKAAQAVGGDDRTMADELADVVADNRIAELSEMNKGELRDILSELSENIELDSIGFDIESLSEYVNVQDLKASDRIIHARFDEIIVEVTCETEREAETLYTDLKQKGMKCRILTL